jgi:hypothetical protein
VLEPRFRQKRLHHTPFLAGIVVPLSQLRGMVERDVFWQNRKKQRWAKRRLWWREHYGWVIVTTLGLLIATAAMVGTYLNLYLTHARP